MNTYANPEEKLKLYCSAEAADRRLPMIRPKAGAPQLTRVPKLPPKTHAWRLAASQHLPRAEVGRSVKPDVG
jgi:hypothetical protein